MAKAITVKTNLDGLDNLLSQSKVDTAQEAVAEAFLGYCDPYVPVDTGALKRSGDFDKDEVFWTEEYANYVYNMDSTRSGAPQWAEKAKSAHLDDLAQVAAEVLTK